MFSLSVHAVSSFAKATLNPRYAYTVKAIALSVSLVTPIDKDGELKIIDTVKDDSTIEEIENRETINDVNKMLSTVNEKEAEFIRDVFGFGGCCIDLETMGKRSGRTKEWARQKRNDILQKLKEQKEQKQNEQQRI